MAYEIVPSENMNSEDFLDVGSVNKEAKRKATEDHRHVQRYRH
eukprot:SAG11_NODE_2969_length_2803_cov_14.767012_5_plen_43_part_00